MCTAISDFSLSVDREERQARRPTVKSPKIEGVLEPGNAKPFHDSLVEGEEVQLKASRLLKPAFSEEFVDLDTDLRGGIGDGQDGPAGAELKRRKKYAPRTQKIMKVRRDLPDDLAEKGQVAAAFLKPDDVGVPGQFDDEPALQENARILRYVVDEHRNPGPIGHHQVMCPEGIQGHL